jgi:hypothetical protein
MADTREKITFLCRQDFANVSTEIAAALRQWSTRHDARVVSMIAHPYGYATPHDYDLRSASPEKLDEATRFLLASSTIVWAEEANVFGDSFSAYGRGNFMGGFLAASGGRRRYVFHAGIAYREGAAVYNPNDTRSFDGQLCSPDLLRLATPRARCVLGKPMTTDLDAVDRLWKRRREAGRVVVTHSPSSHVHKGTAVVRRVMERLTRACREVEYRELGGPLGSHLEHDALLVASEGSVLHIDQYHAGIGGMGIGALEAMARGTLPLASTNLIVDAAYAQWGTSREELPLVPLVFDGQTTATDDATEDALFEILLATCSRPLAELEERGRAAAAWIDAHLAPDAFVPTWEAQLDALAETRVATAA